MFVPYIFGEIMKRTWQCDPYEGHRVLSGLGFFFMVVGAGALLASVIAHAAGIMPTKVSFLFGGSVATCICGGYTTLFAMHVQHKAKQAREKGQS